MKFVALISGGKDSFFNILQCKLNGHQLVALANLHPADKRNDEIDSFMFQTVGHSVIDYYEECVGVPLHKRAITGGSTNVALEYVPTQHDEIEDLYELLKEVKKAHPDVEGVSCGAILSHYQRTRVENVCDRLGLTSLAYLWQLDQSELMNAMCDLGLDARLVKVAAIGLTEKHLGKLISEMCPILTKLNQMYDVHVCGEGGEFETLVLDAPFFLKQLHIVSLEVVAHSSDVSFLTKLEITVLDKPELEVQKFEKPALLLDDFIEVKNAVKEIVESESKHVPVKEKQNTSASFVVLPKVFSLPTRIYISNIVSMASTLEEQTFDVMSQIGLYLSSNGASFAEVQHMTVLVLDMANFARVNSVYGGFFEDIYLPPSRVCVETTLPSPHLLQVSCIVLRPTFEKMGIHIRSRSYWAPQNIGPYSQAIVESRPNFKTTTLSGQIPLQPASMVLDSAASNIENAVLSLQHLYRAKTLVGVRQIADCICFITDKMSPALVSKVWASYVDEVEHGQDFFNRLLIVQTTALPRGATVEWGGLAHEKVVDMYEDDEEVDNTKPEIEALARNFKTSVATVGDGHVVKMVGNDISAAIEFLRNPALGNSYVSFMSSLDTIHKLSNIALSAEWVPVLRVWDSDATEYAFAIIWISSL